MGLQNMALTFASVIVDLLVFLLFFPLVIFIISFNQFIPYVSLSFSNNIVRCTIKPGNRRGKKMCTLYPSL